MWRSINKSVPRAFTERRNVSTYAGDLLSGACRGGAGGRDSFVSAAIERPRGGPGVLPPERARK